MSQTTAVEKATCKTEKHQSKAGMRQSVGIVSQNRGIKTAAMMEQTFTALSKSDLLALEEVHDCYLLDELQDRGYLVKEGGVLEKMELFSLAESMFRFLERREDVTLKDVFNEFFKYVFQYARENGIQHKDIAKILGMSRRMLCHHHMRYKEGRITSQMHI